MALLIFGLFGFLAVHSVRIFAPSMRMDIIAKRGDGAWKGIYSIISILTLVLMIIGYGLVRDEAGQMYEPFAWGRSAALIAMPIALVLLMASNFPRGYIKKAVSHPMLWAVVIWSVVHLSANGDSASVLLFGGFLVWAIMDLVSCYCRPAGDVPTTKIWPDFVSIALGVALTWFFLSFGHEWLMGVAIV